MATDAIRNARIIVHLEQGNVTLKAPDLSTLLSQQEKQLDITKKIADEERKLNEARQSGFRVIDTKPTLPPSVAAQLPPEWGGTAGTGGGAQQIDKTTEAIDKATEATAKASAEVDKWQAGIEKIGTSALPQVDRWREGMQKASEQTQQAADAAAAAQQKSQQQIAAASRNAVTGLMQAGEGFFRLGRAAVLLGATSDGSFGRRIKGLAQVQAYFDLFKGTIQIVMGLQKAMTALQVAQAATATASTAAAGGMTLYARAAGVATAANTALTASLGPIGVALAAIAAACAIAAAAWDLLTTSEAEAAEEAEQTAARIAAAMERAMAAEQKFRAEYNRVQDIRRERMSPEERKNDLDQDSFESFARGRKINAANDPKTDGYADRLQEEKAAYEEAVSFQQRALEAAKEIRNAGIEAADAKIKEIEAQERLVDAAEKELRIVEQKRDAFRVQFGMMNQLEQQELKRIADKLRAGADINANEEQFIAERGGYQGQNIANARRGRRGEAAGADNVFDGIADAGTEMKDAAANLDSVAKALEALAAKLAGPDAQNAEAAKAKLEAEKKALEDQYRQFYEGTWKTIERILQLIAPINDELRRLEGAVERNA